MTMKTKPILLLVLTVLLVSCQSDPVAERPTVEPTVVEQPTARPTIFVQPTAEPTATPTVVPQPTAEPIVTEQPTVEATVVVQPTTEPTVVVQPTAEQAMLNIRFVESAPKDSFIIKNDAACDVGQLRVTFDLVGSAGKLIFDTTDTGAGVEVFQPFEVVEGEITLISSPAVSDGDAELTIQVAELLSGTQARFTIDVDDTLPNSELGMIQVTGSEISGGVVRVVEEGRPQAIITTFDDNSEAVLSVSCTD